MDNNYQNQNGQQPNPNAQQGQYQPRYSAPSGGGGKGSKKGLTIALIALAAVILIGGTIAAVMLLKNNQGSETPSTTDSQLESTAPPTESTAAPSTEPTELNTEGPPPPTETSAEEYEPDEELLSAIEQNSDIYARLSYADCSHLVPAPSNNEFYMNHDAFKNYDHDGVPFVDARCSIIPRSDHIILHGHNWDTSNSGNGGAFANLHKYRTSSYMAENPIFTLEKADTKEIYVPYAIIRVETMPGMPGFTNLAVWNFDDESDFNSFLSSVNANAIYELPVTAEYGDRLMTLSTCYTDYRADGSINSSTEIRLMICLRMLREDETVEGMQELFRTSLSES